MAEFQTSTNEVYITSELGRRPARHDNAVAERLAIQTLARHMAQDPEQVLPSFVEHAMKMTGAVAAGLSIYEPDPAPGVFRWRHLKGSLAAFENATTPRNSSPCGVTLDENRPVLSSHPERVYDWIANANIEVPEVLLVPIRVGDAELLGTLWIVSDTLGHFDSGHARAMTDLSAFVAIALQMERAGHRLQEALEQQELLTKEMSHRLKNVFAMTDGMLRITAKASNSKEELVTVMSGRIHALASAHSMVRRSFADMSDDARVTDLGEIIRSVMQPHQSSAGALRYTVAGPALRCGEHALNGIALIFHELATNAAKYGALSTSDGLVSVSWALEGSSVVFKWAETGGPGVEEAPDRMGFGTKLLNDTVARQFSGTIHTEWKSQGLAVLISIPAIGLTR